MTKWTEVSWKRVGIALLIVCAAPVLLLSSSLIVDTWLAPWRYARSLPAIDPYIDIVPTPVPDGSLATLHGNTIERFGVSFQLPWEHIVWQKTYDTSVLFLSSDGEQITLSKPSSDSSSFATVRLVARATPGLGFEAFQSDCALIGAAMAARPGDVKWWRLPGQNQKYGYLLLMKSLIQVGAPGPPYTVRQGAVCGIQQGAPSSSPSGVKLDLFESAGGHYEMTFNHAQGGIPFTQAEINAIIASFRPAHD